MTALSPFGPVDWRWNSTPADADVGATVVSAIAMTAPSVPLM
jgi:hypothetical protein